MSRYHEFFDGAPLQGGTPWDIELQGGYEIPPIEITSPEDFEPLRYVPEDMQQEYVYAFGFDQRRPLVYPAEQLAVMTHIDEAAAEGYDLFEAESMRGKIVREYPGRCLDMSYVLQALLRTRNVDTQVMEFATAEESGVHFYLRTFKRYGGEKLLIDPTWKQMMPLWEMTPRTDIRPDVLVVPTSRTGLILKAHGIPPKEHDIWTDPREFNQRWQAEGSRILHKVMAGIAWRYPRQAL